MSETPAEPIKTLPLVMEEPRGRKKPPRHLADLTAAERKALLEEQGLPGFRAKQLSTHYFARLVDDPEQMTDLPAGQRADLVGALAYLIQRYGLQREIRHGGLIVVTGDAVLIEEGALPFDRRRSGDSLQRHACGKPDQHA